MPKLTIRPLTRYTMDFGTNHDVNDFFHLYRFFNYQYFCFIHILNGNHFLGGLTR